MKYMGGKSLIAKRVVSAILADTNARAEWWEPFVGGANVIDVAAPHFTRSVGTDVHPDLILLWQHVAAGGEIPEFISRERYQELRHASPSWERGLAGFAASFGGKWFGGYGAQKIDPRHPTDHVYYGSRKTIMRQAASLIANNVIFACGSYADFSPPPGTVIYCDPPYAGTTAYASTGGFDYRNFYSTLIKWSGDCHVYLSEYAVPDDIKVTVIWEREKRNTLGRDDNLRLATERLFRIEA